MRLRTPLRIAAAVLSVTALAGVTACGGDDDKKSDSKASSPAGSAADAKSGLPVTVDAVGGGKATVKDVSRIVALHGAEMQIVYALGFADKVVATDTSAQVLPESKGKPTFGSSRKINVEGLLAQKPSVVIGNVDADKAAVDQLKSAGVPMVAVPKGAKVEDAPTRIQTIANALGVPEKGKELAAKTLAEIDAAKAKAAGNTKKPRVAFLYMRGSQMPPQLGGKGSGLDSLIASAGGVDVGTEIGIQDFKPLTPEAMATAKPDVILAFTNGVASVNGVDGVVALPGVAQTPAGQNKKVVSIDDLEAGAFGAETGKSLDKLITLLNS